MLAPVFHLLPLTTILRERVLDVPGRVVVREGQKVAATDVIAEATFGREHQLIDVSRTLGIGPAAADRLIKCKAGDRLTRDTVVAQGTGMFPRPIRVPRDGRVVAAGGGQILMEVGEASLQVLAGIPGTVVEVIADRGAVIRTAGALVQGMWGNGRADTGLLTSLAEAPDALLEARQLDVSLRGAMILGGHVRDVEVLQAAAELPVRGLILSSLHPALMQAALQARFPILLTDGLGARPMNALAFKILSTNLKRETTIHAQAWNRYSGARPEVVIPLPVSQEQASPRESETFAPGQQVRLRRAPHQGAFGTLTSLRPGLTVLSNGLRAPAADVRLESGEQLIIPLANLEVVA